MGYSRFAVTNAPDGDDVQIVPDTAEAVDQMRSQYPSFWCPTAFGGCGKRMIPHAQRKYRSRRNYFQHSTSTDCPGADSESVEHFLTKLAVRDWLEEQGYQAACEVTLPSGGRSDIALLEDGQPHGSVEVQLSYEDPERILERQSTYLQDLSTVTWLFGPQHLTTAQQLAEGSGVSYGTEIEPDGSVHLYGVSHSGECTAPQPLSAYRYHGGAIHGPGVDRLRQEHQAEEDLRNRIYDSIRQKARPWLERAEKAAGGEWEPPSTSECAALRAGEVLDIAVRTGADTDLGTLVVEEPVRLQRVGVCPFTGRDLYQSPQGAGLRASWRNPYVNPVTIRVAGGDGGDHVSLPSGVYPLTWGDALWAGVPVPRSSFYSEVVTLDGRKPLRPQGPPPTRTRGESWVRHPGRSVVFARCQFFYRGVTKSGRGRWSLMPGGRVLLYPSFWPVASADMGLVTLLLPEGVEPPEQPHKWFTLEDPISEAPVSTANLIGERYVTLSSPGFRQAPIPSGLGRLFNAKLPPPPLRAPAEWERGLDVDASGHAATYMVTTGHADAQRSFGLAVD